MKKGGAIFAFTLKNDKGESASWHIDLKETGTVGKGVAPEGGKANGEWFLATLLAVNGSMFLSSSARRMGALIDDFADNGTE